MSNNLIIMRNGYCFLWAGEGGTVHTGHIHWRVSSNTPVIMNTARTVLFNSKWASLVDFGRAGVGLHERDGIRGGVYAKAYFVEFFHE